VDGAGVGVKAGADCPDRSVYLPCATIIERSWDGQAEVSREHSKSMDRRPNHVVLGGRLELR
jgi:hypothetical protein